VEYLLHRVIDSISKVFGTQQLINCQFRREGGSDSLCLGPRAYRISACMVGAAPCCFVRIGGLFDYCVYQMIETRYGSSLLSRSGVLEVCKHGRVVKPGRREWS
jgi:hypothetical protein